MRRIDGSLARTLDFGDSAVPVARPARLAGQGLAVDAAARSHARGSGSVWWAARPQGSAAMGIDDFRRPGCGTGALGQPNKYRVLEHRRRQAQMNARRLLAALD
jgi:hypothetical protein